MSYLFKPSQFYTYIIMICRCIAHTRHERETFYMLHIKIYEQLTLLRYQVLVSHTIEKRGGWNGMKILSYGWKKFTFSRIERMEREITTFTCARFSYTISFIYLIHISLIFFLLISCTNYRLFTALSVDIS